MRQLHRPFYQKKLFSQWTKKKVRRKGEEAERLPIVACQIEMYVKRFLYGNGCGGGKVKVWIKFFPFSHYKLPVFPLFLFISLPSFFSSFLIEMVWRLCVSGVAHQVTPLTNSFFYCFATDKRHQMESFYFNDNNDDNK